MSAVCYLKSIYLYTRVDRYYENGQLNYKNFTQQMLKQKDLKRTCSIIKNYTHKNSL